jgi:hypothetical protein
MGGVPPEGCADHGLEIVARLPTEVAPDERVGGVFRRRLAPAGLTPRGRKPYTRDALDRFDNLLGRIAAAETHVIGRGIVARGNGVQGQHVGRARSNTWM